MSYSTTWYHLDKDNKVLSKFEDRACFHPISNTHNFEKNLQYLLYDFSNMKVTQKEAKEYFLFLKAIPEFKELMPRSCVQMAKSMQYKVDLHKFNGTKIFTMLTLIRAVVEDPSIVRKVISFDRKKKWNTSLFGILKVCGSVLQTNSNHWITMHVNKDNMNSMFNTREHWDNPTPCIKTGLGKNIFNTFQFHNDGYATKYPVKLDNIQPFKKEVKKVIKYDNSALQLGF